MYSVYILSGLLPIAAEIHRSQLTLFGNIIRQDCVERDVAMRQLAVKDSSSKSWFIMLQETLLRYFRYNLPSAHVLLENPPAKKSWKMEVKCKINKFWELELKNQAKLKSTLKYLNLESFMAGINYGLVQNITLTECRRPLYM